MSDRVRVRAAGPADLAAVKAIMDAHRHELGFVPRPALATAAARGWLLVAELDDRIVGALNWWTRRDGVVVLYNVAVAAGMRGRGVGRSLLDALISWARQRGARQVALKCPEDLPANDFYRRAGFTLRRREPGKRRGLNCWALCLQARS